MVVPPSARRPARRRYRRIGAFGRVVTFLLLALLLASGWCKFALWLDRGHLGFGAGYGAIFIAWVPWGARNGVIRPVYHGVIEIDPHDGAFTFAGWFTSGWNLPARFVTIPGWFALMFVGGVTWRLLRLSRRFPPGRCAECGYDLTGNVSGVCPECGVSLKASEGDEWPRSR